MTSIIKVDQIQTATGAAPTAAGLGLNITGSVLQVLQSVLTTPLVVSSGSFGDLSDFNITFTPKSSSSKILIMPMINLQVYNTGYTIQLRPVVNGVAVGVAAAAGSRGQSMMGNFASGGGATDGNHMNSPTTGMYLHQLSSAASTTVKMQIKTQGGSTVYINRTINDADNTDWATRNISTLTIMEIAG